VENREIVNLLREWVTTSILKESILEDVIGEFGSILRLTQSEEDFILEIEEV